MNSELELPIEPSKNPLRHFLPLEVPSFRNELINYQKSVAVSLKTSLVYNKVCARPGPFLEERQSFPNHIQAQLASGPGDYGYLAYRIWDINVDLNTKEAIVGSVINTRNY